MEKYMFTNFVNGRLTAEGNDIALQDVPWKEHADFKGVFLKNIVTPKHTKGLFTCHLVRIEPRMCIGIHTHPTSIELHEVIAGAGKCITEHGEIQYASGQIAVLLENSPHEVQAGESGLYFFAKFFTVPS
ncbi:cupin [Salmonella enterica subsp. salamae]|nr:cupin [Salmonella enterica subsp. salamae serovar Sofia]EDQ9771761.1 cupin [Salmonella enterica subsp. salamae]